MFKMLGLRTLFGVSNPSTLQTIPSSSLTDSNQKIRLLIDQNNNFSTLFSPITELCYVGPPGNYGANLRIKTVGYAAANATAIHHTLILNDIRVPLINTPNDFKIFIKSTPCMTRSVAIIDASSVINREDGAEKDPIFCTLVYEKHAKIDKIYLYTSSSLDVLIQQEYLQSCFGRQNFQIFTPTHNRRYNHDLSGLYAIEDAAVLSKLDTNILQEAEPKSVSQNSPLIGSSNKAYKFTLDKTFLYCDNHLMLKYATTMLKGIDSKVVALEMLPLPPTCNNV